MWGPSPLLLAALQPLGTCLWPLPWAGGPGARDAPTSLGLAQTETRQPALPTPRRSCVTETTSCPGRTAQAGRGEPLGCAAGQAEPRLSQERKRGAGLVPGSPPTCRPSADSLGETTHERSKTPFFQLHDLMASSLMTTRSVPPKPGSPGARCHLGSELKAEGATPLITTH